MQPILVAYASIEGQTRKVAEFIAERLRIRGHRVDLVDVASPAAAAVAPMYQAAFVGGPVHQHHHPGALLHFVKENRAWLGSLPVAFFSVSMAAAQSDMDSRLEAQRRVDEFLEEAGLRPRASCCVAGALKFTQYDYFKRLIMRMIAERRGERADTSKDHEYTKWDELEAFVDEFLASAHVPVGARPAT
jgi:menaquinone-dependent protoporphyrinogen oxidase